MHQVKVHSSSGPKTCSLQKAPQCSQFHVVSYHTSHSLSFRWNISLENAFQQLQHYFDFCLTLLQST